MTRTRIGELSPGYEASFLVLRDNPLLEMRAVGSISIRVKQGQAVVVPR